MEFFKGLLIISIKQLQAQQGLRHSKPVNVEAYDLGLGNCWVIGEIKVKTMGAWRMEQG